MLEYKKEKKDVEGFITDIVKNLSEPNKQRVADILTGMQLAEPTKKEAPQCPHGVQIQCG